MRLLQLLERRRKIWIYGRSWKLINDKCSQLPRIVALTELCLPSVPTMVGKASDYPGVLSAVHRHDCETRCSSGNAPSGWAFDDSLATDHRPTWTHWKFKDLDHACSEETIKIVMASRQHGKRWVGVAQQRERKKEREERRTTTPPTYRVQDGYHCQWRRMSGSRVDTVEPTTVIESQICHVTCMGLLRKRKLDRLKSKSEGTANEASTCAVPMHAPQSISLWREVGEVGRACEMRYGRGSFGNLVLFLSWVSFFLCLI